jgi:hypothetical protein
MSIFYSPTSSIIYSKPYSDFVVTTDTILSPVSPLAPFNLPLTINFEYSKPIVSIYDTIDTQPSVRKTMLDYYYDKTRDEWLMDDINDILNYFTYRDGKVDFIKSPSEYNPSNIAKDTDQIAEKKVEFIEKLILTKYDLASILEKFIKETRTKWVNLPKNEYYLKQAIREYLLRQINKTLKKH